MHPWAGAQHPPRTLTPSAPPPPVLQNRADLESEKQKIGAVVRNLQRELEESAEETGHWREMFQRNKDELRAAKQECVPANQGVLGAGGLSAPPIPYFHSQTAAGEDGAGGVRGGAAGAAGALCGHAGGSGEGAEQRSRPRRDGSAAHGA